MSLCQNTNSLRQRPFLSFLTSPELLQTTFQSSQVEKGLGWWAKDSVAGSGSGPAMMSWFWVTNSFGHSSPEKSLKWSSDIWEELRVKLLLLHIEGRHLRWFGWRCLLDICLWRCSRHVQLAGHCQAEPGHKGRLRSSIRSWRSWLGTKWSEPSSWTATRCRKLKLTEWWAALSEIKNLQFVGNIYWCK